MARVRLRDLDPAKFINDLEVDGNALVGGDVGIGTGSAETSYTLEVLSSIANAFKIGRSAANDVEFVIHNTEQSWSMGIDRSESNLFTISSNASVGNDGEKRLSVTTDGKVGVGTGSTAPTKKLEINAGDILLSNIGLNKYGLLFGEGANQTMGLRYDGTGSNGNLEIVDASNNLLVNFEYDGKVGINTGSSALLEKLTVNEGNLELKCVGGGTSKIIFSEATLGDKSFYIEHDGTLTGAANLLNIFGDGAGGAAGGITLTRDGKVGIGTGSDEPEVLLHCSGGANEAGLRLGRSSGLLTDGTTYLGSLEFEDDVSTPVKLRAVRTGSGGAAAMTFETGNASDVAERVRISADGKVGIFAKDFAGIKTPSSVFHVKTPQGTEATVRLTQDNWRTWTVGMPAETSVFSIADSGVTRVFNIHHAALADTMWLGADGVAIGADVTGIGANVEKLNVNGRGLFNSGIVFRDGLTGANAARLQYNGQTLEIISVGTGDHIANGHIVLSPTKNVGIGDSEPTHKLTVAGSLYADTISVGTGFVDMAVAGQMTISDFNTEGTSATSAILSLEDETPYLELLCASGYGGKIMFAQGTTQEVAGIEFHSANVIKLHAGESAVLTLKNQAGVPGRFHVLGAGTLVTDADGNFTASSSRDLKTDIQDYNSGLSNVLSLQPVKFKWRQDSGLDYKNHYVGFIAEDAQEALPESVVHPNKITGEKEDEEIDNPNPKSLSDRAIIAALVNSIKELNTRIEQLENN